MQRSKSIAEVKAYNAGTKRWGKKGDPSEFQKRFEQLLAEAKITYKGMPPKNDPTSMKVNTPAEVISFTMSKASGKTIRDLINIIYDEELLMKRYSLCNRNCQHFARHIYQKLTGKDFGYNDGNKKQGQRKTSLTGATVSSTSPKKPKTEPKTQEEPN